MGYLSRKERWIDRVGCYYDPVKESSAQSDATVPTSRTIWTTGLYRDNSYSPSAEMNFCLILVLVDRSLLSYIQHIRLCMHKRLESHLDDFCTEEYQVVDRILLGEG